MQSLGPKAERCLALAESGAGPEGGHKFRQICSPWAQPEAAALSLTTSIRQLLPFPPYS